MKTIEVSESALESLKAMAQKLQEQRDMLFDVVDALALALPKGRDTVKTCYAVTNSLRDSAHAAIEACQESTKVLES